MSYNQPPEYKYCPKCGQPLETRLEERKKKRAFCPNDDFVYYPHSPTAVVGIIWNGEKREVLLVQRGRDPFKGRWSLPAGFMEFAEKPEKALDREIREETDLRVTKTTFLTFSHEFDDERAPGVMAIFFHTEVKGQPILNDSEENTDIRWWPLDNLPPMAWKSHRLVLESLR